MPSRKVVVLGMSVAVLLSISLGSVIVGGVTADNHTEFRVTNAELVDETITEGEATAVIATVENVGPLPRTDTIQLLIDGEVRAERSVFLPRGGSAETSFTVSFDDAGSYDLAVNGVDAGTLTVEPKAVADIAVTDAALARSEIRENESVEVTANVENGGGGSDSGSQTVGLLVDGEVEDETAVTVGPNGSETVSFTFDPAEAGEYNVSVNDVAAGTLTVEATSNPAETPPASVTSARLSADSILTGESVTVTSTVENPRSEATEHTLVLYLDDQEIGDQRIELDPGQIRQVNFTRTFDAAGEYNLSVDDVTAGALTVSDSNSTENESETPTDPQNTTNSTTDNTTDNTTSPDNSTTGDTSSGSGNSTDGSPITDNATEDNSTSQEVPSEVENSTGEGPTDETSGSSGSEGSGSSNTGSSGSSSSSGGGGGGGGSDTEPTVTRSADAVTVRVDGSNDDGDVHSIDLAGPSEAEPAVSLSTAEVNSTDGERFEMTVSRPTADSGELSAVSRGEALAYVDLETDIEVNGTTNLSFEVDPDAIPDDLESEDVRVMRYNEGEWSTAGVTHEFDGEAHHASLSGTASIAIVATEPGTVDVVETGGLVDWVRTGHETTVSVTIRNPGDRPANRTLTIATAGDTVAEREVSLDPDETATVEIAFEPTESGMVTLDGTEIGTLSVGEGDPASPPETMEEMHGFGPLTVLLALLILLLSARVRRS